jgi:hypothetical protein
MLNEHRAFPGHSSKESELATDVGTPPERALGEQYAHMKKAELHEVIRLSLAGYGRCGAEQRGFGRGGDESIEKFLTKVKQNRKKVLQEVRGPEIGEIRASSHPPVSVSHQGHKRMHSA